MHQTSKIHAGFGPAWLLGLQKAYSSKKFTQLLQNQTFPENRAEFASPLQLCAAEVLDKFSGKDVFSNSRSGEGILNNLIVKNAVEKAGIMGKNGVPKIPMYFYHVEDKVMSISGNDALIDGYCKQNFKSLQYVRHKVENHALTTGGVNVLLKDKFDGVAPPKWCHKSDVCWRIWIRRI